MDRSCAVRWLNQTVGAWSVLALAALIPGCPPPAEEPDAARDAARTTRDAAVVFDDVYFDPTVDAYGLDAVFPDAVLVGVDAPVPPPIDAGPRDAGPIDQCEGVAPPPMPCSADDECRSRGFTRCDLPLPGAESCAPCMGLEQECMTDMDCLVRAMTDAGGPVLTDDAGIDGGAPPDAGDPTQLVCNTYGATCACPRRVCELRCVGPTCPDARCDTDGYECPANSMCSPGAATADVHGCVGRTCTTTTDCECGFCTSFGLCANGAGRCQ